MAWRCVNYLRSQLIQTGPTIIRLRLEPKPDVDGEQVWRDVATNLEAYLVNQRLANVDLVRASEPPEQSARSGKFRQVIARPPGTSHELFPGFVNRGGVSVYA